MRIENLIHLPAYPSPIIFDSRSKALITKVLQPCDGFSYDLDNNNVYVNIGNKITVSPKDRFDKYVEYLDDEIVIERYFYHELNQNWLTPLYIKIYEKYHSGVFLFKVGIENVLTHLNGDEDVSDMKFLSDFVIDYLYNFDPIMKDIADDFWEHQASQGNFIVNNFHLENWYTSDCDEFYLDYPWNTIANHRKLIYFYCLDSMKMKNTIVGLKNEIDDIISVESSYKEFNSASIYDFICDLFDFGFSSRSKYSQLIDKNDMIPDDDTLLSIKSCDIDKDDFRKHAFCSNYRCSSCNIPLVLADHQYITEYHSDLMEILVSIHNSSIKEFSIIIDCDDYSSDYTYFDIYFSNNHIVQDLEYNLRKAGRVLPHYFQSYIKHLGINKFDNELVEFVNIESGEKLYVNLVITTIISQFILSNIRPTLTSRFF